MKNNAGESMEVKLRNVRERDLEKIMNWRMQPSVTKYMNTDPVLTLEKQKKWFKSIRADDTCKYWIIVADGTDIGVLGIVDIDEQNKHCTWAMYIADEDFRGKGIAKRLELNLYDYLFYHLKLHRLWSHILAFNEHIIENVHKKVGAEVEGVMKDHVYKNGEFIDVTVMGITSDRWESIKGNFDYEKVEFEEQ
jgi:UDP-4-amino-4,6-dideoxy-N-acetyl-beta-L-altrosamine N-acetyltransferase